MTHTTHCPRCQSPRSDLRCEWGVWWYICRDCGERWGGHTRRMVRG